MCQGLGNHRPLVAPGADHRITSIGGNVIPHRGSTTPSRGSDDDHQRQQRVTMVGLELVKKQPKRGQQTAPCMPVCMPEL